MRGPETIKPGEEPGLSRSKEGRLRRPRGRQEARLAGAPGRPFHHEGEDAGEEQVADQGVERLEAQPKLHRLIQQ